MNSFNECKVITELDLDPIKVKLMHKESGEGWSREQVDAVETEYRRFLYLVKTFPNEYVAPRADVDIFWHYHILDTMKYAADCEGIFGYFLHHFPYVGLRGKTDEEAHEDAGNRMGELYEQTFHEPYVRDAGIEARGRPPIGRAPAFSTQVPRDAIAAAGARTAFSTRVPRDAIMLGATKTAFSTRVPQDSLPGADRNIAFSTHVPLGAVTGQLGTRPGADAPTGNGLSAGISKFTFQRPALKAA
jgi:hypothetical protein